MTEQSSSLNGDEQMDRRAFSGRVAACAMAGGLVVSYGTFAFFAGRYLFASDGMAGEWMYVADLKSLAKTSSLAYTAPGGARINIARLGNQGVAEDFIALSSVCPHLGCQVHWEAPNNRFFCPCHNGVFDPAGKGTGGPPGDADQSLPRYPLKVENGLLYIEVPGATAASERPHQA